MKKLLLFIAVLALIDHSYGQLKFNKEVAAILETIYDEDQAGRIKIDSLQKIYGWQSKEVQSLIGPMIIQDSLNLIRIKKLNPGCMFALWGH